MSLKVAPWEENKDESDRDSGGRTDKRTEEKKLEKVRDDIEWADPDDPRIEGLVNEINYYKQKEEEGILYEPNF